MEFFVFFATTRQGLQKSMPDHDEVQESGLLIGSKVNELETNWLDHYRLFARNLEPAKHYDVIAVFRLSEMNHEPPVPGWLSLYGAMEAGYDLQAQTFFGQCKPWRTFSL